MKQQSSASLLAGLALILSAIGAAAQATFQNLDFESANLGKRVRP